MAVAILLAGGSGRRMASTIPKQFLSLAGKEIWVHTTAAFQRSEGIESIVLVCHADYVDHVKSSVERHDLSKVHSVVMGGKERYHSAFNGLSCCRGINEEKVLFCDVVRPCLSPEVIDRVLLALDDYSCCDTGVNVQETLFEVEEGKITSIPDRTRYALGQGPEGFRYEIVMNALQKYVTCSSENKTNISGIVQKYYPGLEIGFVQGSWDNIKITTPRDLAVASALLEGRSIA